MSDKGAYGLFPQINGEIKGDVEKEGCSTPLNAQNPRVEFWVAP